MFIYLKLKGNEDIKAYFNANFGIFNKVILKIKKIDVGLSSRNEKFSAHGKFCNLYLLKQIDRYIKLFFIED